MKFWVTYPILSHPMNLAFPIRTRLHTYVNGGIETAIGLTLMSPTKRTGFIVLYVGYVVYPLGNLVRTAADL